MTEDELKNREHAQQEVSPQEEVGETFYRDEESEDSYEDYYNTHYGELDEEEIENEKRRTNGWVAKVKSIYQAPINDYRDNVSFQKEYYKDKDNHWLRKQQNLRNDAFLVKLSATVVVLVIVSFIMYLLSQL